ncbi:MAG TPA: hypothetical protein VFF95_18610 [Candidatus Binatus sp.]|jgi:hypothetical protein|nr:hypothetical protein [Candidatus Binatus sp.]
MAISLGSIVVDLIASVGGFLDGMDKATYAGKKATKEIHQSFDEMGSKISGSLSGVFAQLGQFGNVVNDLSRSVGESFDGIGKSGNGIATAVTALGALGAAGVAAAAGFIELGKSGAEVVEKLDLVSQKTGISIRDLQIFQAAGATVGVSLDDMVIGMKKFGQALTGFGKGAAAQSVLRELGVTSKDSKEALLETADAFEKMEDGPRKASDAVALFGKSGMQLIPLLNKGREGIGEWEAALDKLGPVIGKEAVKANQDYKKSIEELSLSWDKVKVDVEQSVIPSLSKATSWIANNFQGIKAGFLGGGMGGAAMLRDQQAQTQSAVDGTKQESAAKDELLKKQEQIQASLQSIYEMHKAGGSAALALETARQKMTDDVAAGLFKEADAIQSQLPQLQKAADLEAQRAAHAKQLAASYAAVMASAAGPIRPLLPTKKSDPTAGIEALFGKQPTKSPLDGAPDLGTGLPDLNFSAVTDALKKNTLVGQGFVNDFYDSWDKRQQKTADSINTSYNKQLDELKGLFALSEVSQADYNSVSEKLEKERQAELKDLRKDNGTSTFKDAFTDMFTSIQASGKDFARSLSSDVGDTLNSLNAELAKFVVTGKGLNFKQIGQGFATNLTSSLLKKGESSLAGSLGGLLGLGGGNRQDGSTAQNAMWVQIATGIGDPGQLPLGNLSSLINLPPAIGGGGSGFLPNLFGGGDSGGGGGVGGFLGMLTGFLPFLADGGDVQPGRSYVVGEKRPELFVPRSAGTIIPQVPGAGQKLSQTNVNLHIHGVTDADSFKKSQAQISSAMGRAASLGQARNSR